jgi:hypothetical protein
MAGLSDRFKKSGYNLPKYMLYIYRKSLFNLSVSSFKEYFKTFNFVFIIRNIYATIDFIHNECELMGIKNYHIVSLDHITRGQAETVFIGIQKSLLSLDESVLIFNIDTIRLGYSLPPAISDWDGYLEVFKGAGKNWSYAKTLPNNTKVIETAEKNEISDNCSTGIYYFKKASFFNTAYEYYLDHNLHINEFYVAPLYNYLIKKGRDIHINIIPSDDVIFCGIPEEYLSCLSNQKLIIL